MMLVVWGSGLKEGMGFLGWEVSLRGSDSVGWCQRLERSEKGVYQMDNPLDLPGALAGDRLSRWCSGRESAYQ